MRSLVISVIFTLFGINLWAANFSGVWSGTGELIRKSAAPTKCSKILIEIDHQTDFMEIKLYDATCGFLFSEWGPIRMDIKDGKVFEDGEETGTFVNDTLITTSTSGGVQYAFNLKLTSNADGKPTLQSYYGVRNLLGVMVIEGSLLKP